MVVDPPRPDPVDPLSNIRGLAQFPKAIRVSSDSNALDSIHQLVKSLGAKNHGKVLEEAKKIVDGGSELLNSNYVTFTASMGIDEASLIKENVNPQERRPGLGRRRAKFSIKPNLSQPPVSLVTSFDMAKFTDPEEFFAEFEKHENAQKEIERQMGGCVSSSIDDDIIPQNAMKRPGILGNSRRAVTYKHRYAQLISETKETLEPSPELTELTVLKPYNSNSSQGNSDVEIEPQDNDAAGSIRKTEHQVNKILDEYLSSNCEDLDDYRAISFLQERLEIKPIELQSLSIPNFKDTEKIDYVALGKNLPKPRSFSFAIENFKQGTPISDKQMGRSANSSLESSTPRNLLGSLSSLRKRVIRSNPLGDLFLPVNIDLTSPRNSQLDEGSEPEPNKELGEKSSHIDVTQNMSHRNLLVDDDGNDMDRNMDHISTEDAQNDTLIDGTAREKENVDDAPSLPMPSVEELDRTENDMTNSPIDNHEPSQMQDNIKNMPSAIFSAPLDICCKESMIVDNVEVDQRSFDEPHADAAKECTSKTLRSARVNTSEQKTKKLPSKNQEHKRKTAVGIIERRNLSKRKSILDGGTTFVSGLRRSKRIKTRPLEYWKGERLLYSRVNDSIKLTGLTYISPSKNNGTLKVKSFI